MNPNQTEITIVRLEAKIDNLTTAFNEFKNTCEKTYVTKDQFNPVRLVVYGMVGIMLSALLGSVVYSRIISPEKSQAAVTAAQQP